MRQLNRLNSCEEEFVLGQEEAC